MTYFITFFAIFWLLRTAKAMFFYLYLWQLKEYQVSRFLSHFHTEKGKGLFLNYIFTFKILAFFAVSRLLFSENYFGGKPIFTFIAGVFLALYIFETFLGARSLLKKEFKMPKVTVKSGFLIFASLFLEIAVFFYALSRAGDYIFNAIAFLIFFDIAAPAIVSAIVFLFQPAAVFYRNNFVLSPARKKIAGRRDLVSIGITGSFGKTSAKEFLSALLSEKFSVLKTAAHQNSEAGISACILNELANQKIFIAEMGAYGQGGIKLLAGISKPQIGILTGINAQHISLFGSQEKITGAKYELIESLPENGLAVFNGDNVICGELYKKTAKPKKIYGMNKITASGIGADAWAENVKVEKEFIVFDACFAGGDRIALKVNTLGGHNILNLLGGLLVSKALGLSDEEIKKGILKITPEQGPMVLVPGKKDPYFIDATYSANPDGVLADLEYLKVWPSKKAIVMPCLIELEEKSEEAHRRIGKKIAEVCDLAIITSKECFNYLREEAIKNGMKDENILYMEDPKLIINELKIFASVGDVALLEGRAPEKLMAEIKK